MGGKDLGAFLLGGVAGISTRRREGWRIYFSNGITVSNVFPIQRIGCAVSPLISSVPILFFWFSVWEMMTNLE